jgi:N-methylhydantoinase A
VNGVLDTLAAEAAAAFAADGVPGAALVLSRLVRLRYRNQDHSVEIALPPEPLGPANLDALLSDFAARYRREYTYTLDAPVEVVGVHLVASADIGKPGTPPMPVTGRRLEATLKGRRPVDFDIEGVHDAAIHDGDLMEPGMAVAGPAIIELAATIVIVHPADHAEVDRYGNFHLRRARRIGQ